MDKKPQLTDIQQGLRDAIRYHEELGGILRNLQEEVETILEDYNFERNAEITSLKHKGLLGS